MKPHSFCLKKCAAALFLIGKLTIAEALTLGTLQGAAILGRPLDVTATVQLAAGESASELCLEGSVTQGDARYAGSRVRVIGESAQTPGQIRVRISSSGPLIEPVVNVELRAGCKQTLTRQYVLLADLEAEPTMVPLVSTEADRGRVVTLAPEVSASANTHNKDKASTASTQNPVEGTPAKGSLASKSAANVPITKMAASSVAKVKKSSDAVPVKAAADAQAVKPEGSKSAKLKLSASQVLAEKSPDLKPSPQLEQLPVPSSPAAPQASAIWKASNLPVEDVAADAKRMEEFQSDIKTLRNQVQNNEKLLLEMRTALLNAENGRVDVTWLYLLGLGFMASSAAGVWLWRRQQSGQRPIYWQAEEIKQSPDERSPVEPVIAPAPVEPVSLSSLAPEMAPEAYPEVPVVSAPVDIDLDIYESIINPPSQSAMDSVLAPMSVAPPAAVAIPKPPVVSPFTAAPAPLRSAFAPSAYAGLRVATVEELFDIRQQAEFFVSLGQYDQAIQILRDCIGETEEARPIAYLDLLEIYHTLGRKRDFDACVLDFNQIFSGRIPSFENFKTEGKGIESYGDIFAHIESSWVTAATLEMIESLIFVNPQDPNQTYFDLAAFNDLLLLHGVAKRLLGAEAGFVDTNRAALIKNPFVGLGASTDASPSATVQTEAAGPVSAEQRPAVADNNLIDFDFVLPDEK